MTKKKIGFALLPDQKRTEMASLGGRTARSNPNTHRFTHETAKAAGRKGGIMRQRQLKFPWG